MQRDEATQRQITAAQPGRSTWLSANAGSGKTRVLTDRVARLLLDQVNPQHILCLTYTKAAASEMQNRLFRRLGEWAMLPDDELTHQLNALGIEHNLDASDLSHARRLFASAIETPGGLKIQTIHSFCSSLLRRFPLEAGVTPQFTEMDDRAAVHLRADIVEEIAAGDHSDTFYQVALHYGGGDFADLTAEIIRHSTSFSTPLTNQALENLFGYPADLSISDVARQVFLGDEGELIAALLPVLRVSGVNDQKAAKKLGALTRLDESCLTALEDLFLLKSGDSAFCAKLPGITRQPFPTKGVREKHPDLMEQLDALMRRVEDARPARLAAEAIAKTRALHRFAGVFLPAYTQAKQARGWLDFDDLILRARDLLTDPDVAAWVLFRLDGGIDHILVDEAQDTSPVQWKVIERLAQEFTSGEGARPDLLRTIFVVGDKKQSIYSFQGADPREFDRMQREFADRMSSSETPLQVMEMEYSFRSSPAILSLVDHTFSKSQQSGFAPDQQHKAFKADMPGRVDLWPVIPAPEKEEKPAWHTPVDIKAENDPAILLARQVADTIKSLIDLGHPMPLDPEKGGPYRFRPVQPGDFLILVQRRSDLFHEIIRECKARDLPIAGADRLKVGAELAVRDLSALLSFLATPEDSLSLAVALKSPLFGWTEAQLYALAHHRKETYLWAEMRNREDDFPDVMPILRDLRRQADFLRPYDLIERILTRHGGRQNLLARLGIEAEDGIDALLAQALAYEKNAVDSLTGFLTWMETDDLEVKRQMDSAGNRIRVMTVHGAKGLEAPIVILPDAGKRDIRLRDQVVLAEGTPVWRTAADVSPDRITATTEAMKEAEQAERDRLLYVAMTRAEKWLIVGAAGELGKQGNTWYDKIHAGMLAAGASEHSYEGGQGLRLDHGNWAAAPAEARSEALPATPPLPAFFTHPVTDTAAPLATLSPSDLGGAKALPGDDGQDEETAKRRGRQIHLLLEHLPGHAAEDWVAMAKSILSSGADAANEDEIAELLSEARGVLQAGTLQALFVPEALVEVPVSATLDLLQGRRIHGIIDRLLVNDTTVLAVDFKTNALVPATPFDCPEGILRQMGAYSEALQLLYPAHKIETAVVWTRPAQIMPLPHDLVTEALRRTQIS